MDWIVRYDYTDSDWLCRWLYHQIQKERRKMYWLSVCWKLPQQQSAKGTDFLLWLSAQCESEVMFHQSLLCKKVKHLAEIPFFRANSNARFRVSIRGNGHFSMSHFDTQGKTSDRISPPLHAREPAIRFGSPKKFIKTNFLSAHDRKNCKCLECMLLYTKKTCPKVKRHDREWRTHHAYPKICRGLFGNHPAADASKRLCTLN